MMAKIVSKGTSFKGLAAYLLHDPDRAKTSNRVEWTSTRNLATHNPDAAWRVMAATAMEASTLKKEAGVSSRGNKAKTTALHMVLSWHDEEAANLTKEEMLRAAVAALEEIGADKHQALIVCHNDGKPHVHIALNRVSPEDGRTFDPSYDRLALSRWAQKYEEQRLEAGITDRIYCEERVLNNAARDRGQFTRGQKDIPRAVFEKFVLKKKDGTKVRLDRTVSGAKLREKEQRKDKALRKKEMAARKKIDAQWTTLQQGYKTDMKRLKRDAQRQITIARQAAGAAFEDDWAALRLSQEDERMEFAKREQSLAGKGRNILKLLPQLDWGELLRSGRRSEVLSEGFGLLAGRKGVRSETLRRLQERQTIALEKREKEAKKQAADVERAKQSRKMAALQQAFLAKRGFWIDKRDGHSQSYAEKWALRRAERTAAWDKERTKAASRDFEQQATPEKERNEAALKFMTKMRRLRAEKEQDVEKSEKEESLSLAERRRRARERGRGRSR